MTGPDCAALARLHLSAFPRDRGWSAAEIAQMLAAPGTDLREAPGGFIITCAVCDEAEILTLAVAPDRRRCGVATALLAQAERHLAAGGTRVLHLEVSTENTAALALYERAGYTETGRRKGYYRATDHRRADAVLMAKRLVP